ncbi:MAG: hypothetical protein AB1420_12525 [Bacillota bacterium]
MLLNEHHSIRSCVSHCKSTLEDLNEIRQHAYDNRAKNELDKALHSLDICIKQCEAAQNNAR